MLIIHFGRSKKTSIRPKALIPHSLASVNIRTDGWRFEAMAETTNAVFNDQHEYN